MFQLERIIHKWNDEAGGTEYHPDALWLEEVRHIIHANERELVEARNDLKLQISENMRAAEDIWHAREALRKAIPHLDSGIFREPEDAEKLHMEIRAILSNALITESSPK